MGLYITGKFEPPKANYKLVQLWYDGYAHFLTEDGMVTGTWTLVPDHGDLIDREALNVTDSWEWIRHDAPVIIPAERMDE